MPYANRWAELRLGAPASDFAEMDIDVLFTRKIEWKMPPEVSARWHLCAFILFISYPNIANRSSSIFVRSSFMELT